MTDQASKEWAQKVEAALLKSSQFPSAEKEFLFPWEHVVPVIAEALGIQNLKLSPLSSSWKTSEELLSGMGEKPVTFNLELSPIAGTIQWIMSSEDVASLSTHCISADQKGGGFSDPKLQEGYYNFLILQAVQAVDQLKVFKDAAIHLLASGPVSQEGGFCIDIGISIQSKTVYGRLVCSSNFLDAFKTHQPLQKGGLVSSDRIKEMEVQLHFEVGGVNLSPEEWKSAMPGDFITLDHCSYDPDSQKGSAILMLDTSPLLRGRIKPEGVKILEDAFFFEDHASEQPLESEITEEEPLIPEEEMEWEGSLDEEMETEIKKEEPSITLSIETGHILMTVGKLLELTPDTMLDLSIRPEQGVDAVINGKKIAKGEVIKLGQLIGIRLLDIYPS